MTPERTKRIAYLDWMRGFACVVMFQTHCYDSWLSPAAHQSAFSKWSQLGGTLPAPLFLFLAGVAVAFTTDRMRQKGLPPGAIARKTMLRGGEVLVYGLLFRLQEFLLGYGGAPRTDLLRVDVLNIIGVSIVLLGAVNWLGSRIAQGCSTSRDRAARFVLSVCVAAAISLATPWLWTTARPRWLPWYLESYINGVHIYDQPQAGLFPLFPWGAFAVAGLAVGILIFSEAARRHEAATAFTSAGVGGILIWLALWLDARRFQLVPVYDFWHTSPNFFLARVGILLIILCAAYVWCRWGAGQWGFSPLIEMGKCSLLVYWVHIEFVYGSLSILPKHACSIRTATAGLAIIFAAMTLLAVLRNRLKGRGPDIWARLKRAAPAAS
jgi:uncharacterized membrane protein